MYIIRFRKGVKMVTYRVVDRNTTEEIVDDLENKEIDYLVMKSIKGDVRTYTRLVDFESYIRMYNAKEGGEIC